LLAGCERAVLLAHDALVEASITVEAFEAAEGIAFLNSVRGWRRAPLMD